MYGTLHCVSFKKIPKVVSAVMFVYYHTIRRFGDKTQTYSFAVSYIYRLIDRLIDRVWYLIFPQGISGELESVFL